MPQMEKNQRCNYHSVSVSFAGIGRQTNCYLGYFLMRACSRMEMTLKLLELAIHIQTLFWIQIGMLGRKPIFPLYVWCGFCGYEQTSFVMQGLYRCRVDILFEAVLLGHFFLVRRDHMAWHPVSLFWIMLNLKYIVKLKSKYVWWSGKAIHIVLKPTIFPDQKYVSFFFFAFLSIRCIVLFTLEGTKHKIKFSRVLNRQTKCLLKVHVSTLKTAQHNTVLVI